MFDIALLLEFTLTYDDKKCCASAPTYSQNASKVVKESSATMVVSDTLGAPCKERSAPRYLTEDRFDATDNIEEVGSDPNDAITIDIDDSARVVPMVCLGAIDGSTTNAPLLVNPVKDILTIRVVCAEQSLTSFTPASREHLTGEQLVVGTVTDNDFAQTCFACATNHMLWQLVHGGLHVFNICDGSILASGVCLPNVSIYS